MLLGPVPDDLADRDLSILGLTPGFLPDGQNAGEIIGHETHGRLSHGQFVAVDGEGQLVVDAPKGLDNRRRRYEIRPITVVDG